MQIEKDRKEEIGIDGKIQKPIIRKKSSALVVDILDNLELFFNNEKDPIEFLTLLDENLTRLQKQQILQLHRGFNFQRFVEKISEFQNQDILLLGLKILSFLCQYSSSNRNSIFNEEFANFINNIFHSDSQQAGIYCISIISDMIFYNFNLYQYFADGLLEKILTIPPTESSVYTIILIVSNFQEHVNEILPLLDYFVKSDDELALNQLMSLLSYLYTEIESTEIQERVLLFFFQNFNHLISSRTRFIMSAALKFLIDVETSKIILPNDFFQLIIRMLQEIDPNKANADQEYSSFIILVARFLYHMVPVWKGQYDEIICNEMKRFYGKLGFNCTKSTFRCFIAYFHFELWFNEEIYEDIIKYCESAPIAYVCFKSVLSAYGEAPSDSLFELIQDLIPLAETHVDDENQTYSSAAEMFINEATQLE